MRERLIGWRRIFYSCGNAGFQLGERIVLSVAVYFYLPPAGRGLSQQVSQEIFIGGLTAFGLAMLIGRFFDAIADPLVAQASDSSTSALGRRRIFMLIGSVPMTLLPVMLFWPPGVPGSTANFWWLAVLLAFYFVFFTFYVAPYLALIPEIAHNHEQRLSLATLMAVVAIPVVGLYGVAWPWGFDWIRSTGMTAPDSIRLIVVATALVSFFLCLLPVLAVDERRLVASRHSRLKLGHAIRETLWNRPFLVYLAAQIFFVVGINLIQPALIYYATVVLGRTERFAGNLGLVMFISIALSFFVIKRVSGRIGAKWTAVICVIVFSLCLFSLGLLQPGAPGTPEDSRNLTILFVALPVSGLSVAGFLVLPAVLISQIIDRDHARTGASRAAMFFGIQGLVTKLMYGVSTSILAFLFARFGNSADEPFGVLLIAPVAGFFCLVSGILFALYPERSVLAAPESDA